ncbi:hypothetical protein [Nonomuraea sp. NPDC049400]|uniref:hypothetical protein n=1 Tax=Nonomuraea sp. NPDC049400 TaxID=3364352 RepID=UPI0037A872DC
MTGDWLALNEAAKRLSQAWGRHVSMDDVIRLGDQERLIVRFQHGHFSVLEASVSELAAHGGDGQTVGPTVGGGPELPAEIEDEYPRGQNT